MCCQAIAEQEAEHWDKHQRLKQRLQAAEEAPPPRFEMPTDLVEEKAALLTAAFPEWKKKDFTDFVSACERFGRHDHVQIALAMPVGHLSFSLINTVYFYLGFLPAKDFHIAITTSASSRATLRAHMDRMNSW